MALKKSVWLTYAWEDNIHQDVDSIANELEKEGVGVKLDRWNLDAGKRLWEQISSYIEDPFKSDGWIFFATQASLNSEKCKEELYYALNRVLESRTDEYPFVTIFPASVDEDIVPLCIKSRLYVTLTDSDWKERTVAAIEGRKPNIERPHVEPFYFNIHSKKEGDRYAIEVRPRAGTWNPFYAAIPIDEKDQVDLRLFHGAANKNPFNNQILSCSLSNYRSSISPDGEFWIESAGNEATPTQSYYLLCNKKPSRLIFGELGGSSNYEKLIKDEY